MQLRPLGAQPLSLARSFPADEGGAEHGADKVGTTAWHETGHAHFYNRSRACRAHRGRQKCEEVLASAGIQKPGWPAAASVTAASAPLCPRRPCPLAQAMAPLPGCKVLLAVFVFTYAVGVAALVDDPNDGTCAV